MPKTDKEKWGLVIQGLRDLGNSLHPIGDLDYDALADFVKEKVGRNATDHLH